MSKSFFNNNIRFAGEFLSGGSEFEQFLVFREPIQGPDEKNISSIARKGSLC